MEIEPNEMEELRENAHEAGEFMIGTLVVGLSAAEGIAENLVAERDALRAQLSALREQDPVAAVWQAAHLAGQRAMQERAAKLLGDAAENCRKSPMPHYGIPIVFDKAKEEVLALEVKL